MCSWVRPVIGNGGGQPEQLLDEDRTHQIVGDPVGAAAASELACRRGLVLPVSGTPCIEPGTEERHGDEGVLETPAYLEGIVDDPVDVVYDGRDREPVVQSFDDVRVDGVGV